MPDEIWIAISAVSAAAAAIASLCAVGISVRNEKKRNSQATTKNTMALYSALVLVDRTLDYAIRKPSRDACGKVEQYLVKLLDVIVATGGVKQDLSHLPADIVKCLSFIDELKLNDFTEEYVQKQLSEHELEFRKVKHELEDELGIKYTIPSELIS